MCQEKAAPGWEGARLHNGTVRARGHGAEGLCFLGARVGHCWWEQMWESAGGNEYWDQVGKGKAGRKCVSSELCECQASMERGQKAVDGKRRKESCLLQLLLANSLYSCPEYFSDEGLDFL